MSPPYSDLNNSDAHQTVKTIKDLGLIKAMWPFIKPQWRSVVVSMCLLPLVSLTQVIQPFVVKQAIDGPIKAGNMAGLGAWALVFAGLLVAHYGLRYVQMQITQRTGQRVVLALRTHLFDHLQHLSMRYYHQTPVGKIVTRVTSDVENVSEMFASGGVEIFIDIALIVGILVAMVVMNPTFALVTVFILPFVFTVMEYFRRKSRATYNQLRVQQADINTTLQESLTGMDVIQLLNRQAHNLQVFDGLNRRYLKSNIQSIVYDCGFSASIEWFAYTTMLGIIGLYVWVQWQGWTAQEVSLGGLVAFIQYVQMLFLPLEDISDKFTIIQSGLASIEKIDEILSVTPEIQDPTQPVTIDQKLKGTISFENVVFGYDPNLPILKGLNLSIPAGQKVALIGSTGAGKSTVIRLLDRQYDPQSGRVCVDGHSLTAYPVGALRAQIGVIQQEEFIFSRSIEENITLEPKNPAYAERLRQVAQQVHALGFIDRLSDGFDTVLSERGRNLSSGERQLLVFARALWHDPAVLVLDEATASIDPNTEALVQQAFYEAIQGRTAIIIAHRLSTIEAVDRIVVLEHGQVVEDGSPAALLAARGAYWQYTQTHLQEV